RLVEVQVLPRVPMLVEMDRQTLAVVVNRAHVHELGFVERREIRTPACESSDVLERRPHGIAIEVESRQERTPDQLSTYDHQTPPALQPGEASDEAIRSSLRAGHPARNRSSISSTHSSVRCSSPAHT